MALSALCFVTQTGHDGIFTKASETVELMSPDDPRPRELDRLDDVMKVDGLAGSVIRCRGDGLQPASLIVRQSPDSVSFPKSQRTRVAATRAEVLVVEVVRLRAQLVVLWATGMPDVQGRTLPNWTSSP
jgi:hypothetical protein